MKSKTERETFQTEMEAPPNSLNSSLASSTSMLHPTPATMSYSASNVSSVQSTQLRVLKVPASFNNFTAATDDAIRNPTKHTEISDDIFPPTVFKQHLSLLKKEDKTLQRLYEELENPDEPPADKKRSSQLRSDIMHDKGSKSNLMNMKNISSYILSAASREPKDLDPSKRIILDDVLSTPAVKHTGKYLLCLNAALPVLSRIEEAYILNTVVETSHINFKVARVEIRCNLKSAETFFHMLKHPYLNNLEPGSVILIQDPCFTNSVNGWEDQVNLCIQARDAKDVEFLAWQTFQSLMPENAADPSRNSYIFERLGHSDTSDVKRSSSFNISSAIEMKNAAEEWRQWGNEYSVARLHTQAFFAYSTAIRFDPESVDLAASRSASLISLGFYKAAMNDVDFIISRDPLNTGYILRKVNCFWGQGEYEEAIEYLKALLTKLLQESSGGGDFELRRKSMFIQRIIVKTEDMIERRDTPGLLGSEKYFRNSSKLFYDEPEYYNPIRVTYENRDDFKSKKIVVARRQVKAGHLLVITRALSVVFLNETSKLLVDANDELMNATIQKIQLDKPTKSSIYKFSCSEEKLSRKDCEETGMCMEFSKEDIRDLCESYFYSCNTPQEQTTSNSQTTTIGIWPFLKNIRHRCVGGNAVWYTCGNFLFVRAIRDIQQGEEIIMAHIEPTEPYTKRTQFLEQRGLECNCVLCSFERDESDTVKAKRLALLNEMRLMDELSALDWSKDLTLNKAKKIQFYIEDLTVLRSAYTNLNFPIVEPLKNYGQHLMRCERYDDAIRAFDKAFFVVNNTAAIFVQIVLSLHLSYCYIARKRNRDKNRSKKWFNAMKNYAMLLYGCLDPVKFHFRNEFDYLESKGIASSK